MYIVRLAPISMNKEEWTFPSSINFDAITDPDNIVVPNIWSAASTWQAGDSVQQEPYVYISLVSDNSTKPSENYLGRPAELLDGHLGDGTNSWVRYRLLTRYACFNRVQPGFSWSSSGTFSFSVFFRGAMPREEEGVFFGAPYEPSPMYLFLTDVRGSAVTVSIKDIMGGIVSQETISLDYSETICPDFMVNMELPGIARDTIIRKFDINESVTAIRTISVSIAPMSGATTLQRAGLGGFYIGRATKIGNTDQSKLSFGYTDRTKVEEDDWGHININRRKYSRTTAGSSVVDTRQADSIYRLFQTVRATPSMYVFSNDIDRHVGVGNVSTCLHALMGLAKPPSITTDNARISVLNFSIEGMPVAFEDILHTDPIGC